MEQVVSWSTEDSVGSQNTYDYSGHFKILWAQKYGLIRKLLHLHVMRSLCEQHLICNQKMFVIFRFVFQRQNVLQFMIIQIKQTIPKGFNSLPGEIAKSFV